MYVVTIKQWAFENGSECDGAKNLFIFDIVQTSNLHPLLMECIREGKTSYIPIDNIIAAIYYESADNS